MYVAKQADTSVIEHQINHPHAGDADIIMMTLLAALTNLITVEMCGHKIRVSLLFRVLWIIKLYKYFAILHSLK
mgnify:CR=1 FL=1